MLNQSELQLKIDELFTKIDQEISQGVAFDSIAPLVEELKVEYARIKTRKSARAVKREKGEYLQELALLVSSMQNLLFLENGNKFELPAWTKNTDKVESIVFYQAFLNEVKKLPTEQSKVLFYFRGHEVEYYEEILGKILVLESQRGTKEDYLMLLNIRRSLVSCLCLVGWRCGEV